MNVKEPPTKAKFHNHLDLTTSFNSEKVREYENSPAPKSGTVQNEVSRRQEVELQVIDEEEEKDQSGCGLIEPPQPSSMERLDIFLGNFDVEQEKRLSELKEFLEDLANFKEQLRKQNTRDKATEVLPRHLILYARTLGEASTVDEFPCTKYTQKLHRLHAKLKKAMQRKEALQVMMKQEEGIRAIREKIKEAEETHLCSQDRKNELRKMKMERALGEVGVDSKDFSTQMRMQLAERVISVKKIRHLQRLGRQERCRAIVKKLLLEEKRGKEIEAAKNKRYDYKVKRIAKTVEMTGSSEVLHKRCMSDESEAIDEEEVEEVKPEEVVVQEVKKKGKKPKKKKKSKKGSKASKKKGKKGGGKKKKSKKRKEKKSKRGKAKKKSLKGGIEDLVLPEAPITNPRRKISPEDVEMMADLVKEYENFAQTLEDRDEAHAQRGLDYERDASFHWTPNPVVFKDFRNGKVYKKRITIVNGGDTPKKCRLDKIEMEDGFDPTYFDIDVMSVQYIIPGLSFKVTVTFFSQKLDRPTEGKITLITYGSHRPSCYGKFIIPIKCTPINDSISFHPKVLAFDRVPIWQAKKQSKTLKVTNPGQKVHRVVIKRLHNDVDHWRNSKFDLSESILDEEAPLKTMVGELLVNLFNAFGFSSYFLEISPNAEETLKVTFRNVDHVGCYLEQYACEIYEESRDGDFHYAGSKEVLVTAETTGHVLRPCPNILDFDQCVFDSVYRRNFELHNDDGIPHQVRMKIPACLRDYVGTSMGDACVQAFAHQDISLRLVPRREMLTDREVLRYFDVQTGILEFPIRICPLSNNMDDVPSVVITVYAVIGGSAGVVLAPIDLGVVSREQGDLLIDLGECSTSETMWTAIAVTNLSYTQQHFGFLDLPQCIYIESNFGFDVLEPMETKVLNVMLSPNVHDLSHLGSPKANGTLTFRITAKTIKELGGIKKPFNCRKLRKSLEMVETLLKTKEKDPLEEDMMMLCNWLTVDGQNDLGEVKTSSDADLDFGEVDSSDAQDTNDVHPGSNAELCIPNNSRETTESWSNQRFDMAKTNTILIRCTIIDPLCSFSHQRVVFPSTPCGSYSMAGVSLSAKENSHGICGHQNKPVAPYLANFKIVGNDEQFRIEPTCGELKNGEVVKITLIARPELPRELIDAKAEHIQREKLIAKKREELILKRERERAAKLLKGSKTKGKKKKGKKRGDKSSKGTKQKGKKSPREKKKGDKSSKGSKQKKGKKRKDASSKGKKDTSDEQSEPEALPPIFIDDKDILVTYWDLYPAEMCLWREFEPYCIFAQFTCEISYDPKSTKRKSEKLHLSVECRVIPPDFVHNLNVQHLNFGPTPLGMARKHILEIQNIKYEPIRPEVTRPCPMGPFTCPDTSGVELPPEHRLQLPITFRPFELKEVCEFVEVVSGKTICPLILSGEGVVVNVTISPAFLVCRLEASPNGFVDVALEINNSCAGSIVIKFDKVCELEGEMKVMPKAAEKGKKKRKGKSKGGSGKKSSKSSKGKKSSKSSKGKKSSKSSKGKKGSKSSKRGKKASKFSDQLTEDEIHSLMNLFREREGPSLFEIVGGNSVEIPAHSRQAVKLRFGFGPPPAQEKDGGKKKKKKTKKGKSAKGKKEKTSKSSKGKKEKKSKSSKGKKEKMSKSSKKSKRSKKSTGGGGKFHVAKFNVMVGNSAFLKDFIAVGKFA